ncbi:hypothetical protein IQA64_17075 [Leptospira borgpetersenii serovar Tarassovi]|nr:hypothetical protein [Leptospira borgpetersenii serovar Tarassovi]MBE8404538.1 hypothetical protein [Leptospira borgpetersenii serovar Tarassovi]MBE8406862.1 hypothetical protein [Leptospira borgpetersenii serovar Tarassovi]MBE8417296.1 hypothetical protein [Leptospira borgpetersenii serovar Tarassovi]MBE8427469.1 hypothetical protein [Leptospira borgpetersenii serovar Tarassovi]
MRGKKIDQVIAEAYLAVSWKLKEFAPFVLLWDGKKCDAGGPYVSVGSQEDTAKNQRRIT